MEKSFWISRIRNHFRLLASVRPASCSRSCKEIWTGSGSLLTRGSVRKGCSAGGIRRTGLGYSRRSGISMAHTSMSGMGRSGWLQPPSGMTRTGFSSGRMASPRTSFPIAFTIGISSSGGLIAWLMSGGLTTTATSQGSRPRYNRWGIRPRTFMWCWSRWFRSFGAGYRFQCQSAVGSS